MCEMHVCIHAYIHTYTKAPHASVCIYAYMSVCAYKCVFMCTWVRIIAQIYMTHTATCKINETKPRRD